MTFLRRSTPSTWATALALASELHAFVTYDDRLAAAARELGMPVVQPA